MCGLVCVVSKSKYGMAAQDVRAFELMLFMDTLRGEDSTGVFLVDNIGNVMIAKEAVDGPKFLQTKEWADIRRSAIQRGWVLVGHNRKATRGVISDENAHPFWVEDKIVLVHNGSMYGNHKHLADTEVDSHAIAHTIASESSVEAALQKINAAYALMWYNVQEKSFNIIRNSQRPLHFNSNNNAWFFTSEDSILEFALKRADVKHLKPETSSLITNSLQKWTLKEDKSYSLEDIKLDCTFRAPQGAIQTQYHGNPPWYMQHACGWQSEWEEYANEKATSQTSATTKALPDYPPLMKSFLERHKETNQWEEEITYARFVSLRQYSLSNNSRIRVVVEDFDLNVENNDQPCFMICRYSLSEHSAPIKVVFPISAEDIDFYIQQEEDIVFYVNVKDHYWKTTSGNEYSDLSKGFATIWAENPTKVVIQNKNQSTVH
jgi:hypothetical protein